MATKKPARSKLTYHLHTWGVSDDMQRATGLEDERVFGPMDTKQLVAGLQRFQELGADPDAEEMPPRAEVRGTAGTFDLYADGGQVYCPQTDSHLDAKEVPDMVRGRGKWTPKPVVAAKKPSGAVGCLRLALAVPVALVLAMMCVAGGIRVISDGDQPIIQALGFFVIFWGLTLTLWIYRLIRGSVDAPGV